MADFDRRSSTETKSTNMCSQCGIMLDKLGILHNKRHHVLSDSSGKQSRACQSCWDKLNPQVNYRIELEQANLKLKELAGLLAAEKQGREYDRVLFRTEADSHRISMHKLEKDNQTALEHARKEKDAEVSAVTAKLHAVKAKKRTAKQELARAQQTVSDLQSNISALQESARQTATLQQKLTEQAKRYEEDSKRAGDKLEEERKVTETLREKARDMQNQLDGVKGYHQTELKLMKEDYDEIVSRLKSDLQALTESANSDKAEKTQWKKQADDQKALLQKTLSELSDLTGDHTKLLSKQKQLEENERSLLATIDALKADKSFSEKETELLNISLQLKSTSTHASELQADNTDIRQRVIPALQQRIDELSSELADAKAASDNEQREKERMHLQLQEVMKRADDVRRELSKKTHAEAKAAIGAESQHTDACISCFLM